jgi:ubiquinone biosynthesis protein
VRTFIRFIRALLIFGRIFASLLLQMGLQKIFGRKRLKNRWKRVHRRNARRMYKGFVKLRGVYIKLGQVLSIMGSFLPRAYAEELEGLQDQVPPHKYKEVEETFRKSLGKTPREVFAEFNEKPLAAASLGQVHEARMKDGTRVAVKVLYPNVKKIIAVDMRVLRIAMRVYKWFVPMRAIERVVDQLTDLLERETNYLHEARCMARAATYFTDDPDVLFPTSFPALTSEGVLTMTFMDGIKISKRDALIAAGADPDQVARKLVEVFYKQLFVDGFFHADPHPGNFLVQPPVVEAGTPMRIVMLDFGAVSDVRMNLVDGMLEILKGLFAKDDSLVIKGIGTMGFIAIDGDRALLETTIKEYFQKLLGLDIKDFSRFKGEDMEKFARPNLAREQLRELMKSVEYPEGWFFVERAVVILFGLSAQLAPTLNTIQVGFPYIMRLMATRMAAQAAEASQAS